jgi:hypothetical protein
MELLHCASLLQRDRSAPIMIGRSAETPYCFPRLATSGQLQHGLSLSIWAANLIVARDITDAPATDVLDLAIDPRAIARHNDARA